MHCMVFELYLNKAAAKKKKKKEKRKEKTDKKNLTVGQLPSTQSVVPANLNTLVCLDGYPTCGCWDRATNLYV